MKRKTGVKKSAIVAFAACLCLSPTEAGDAFLNGFTLNEGRRIAFTQALPRMRNADTGKPCGWYNNKDLAIPGVLTTTDRSYGEFLHCLRNVITDERALVFVDGRTFMVNKNWIRDHVHVLKGMRHWEYDYAGYVDFTIDHQRDDGCILELIKQADDYHWKFAAPESRKFFPEDNLAMSRLDIEADVEYLLVEGAVYCYRISADDAWLARVLPRLEKAIDYMTSDPQRWDPKYGLVKRGYTIDTWDFTYLKESGNDRTLKPDTPQAIMHGDNSGVFQAMNQLAWFNERLGRGDKAASWRRRADALKENMYKHLWNGKFFIHQLPLNVPPVDGHERERLSLSAAYDMNRGLMSVDDCRKTIGEFIRRRKTTECFAEWFTVDPPYDFTFCRHPKGDYVNGGICLFTAGELAKAALENGYEEYGWDILSRVKRMAERDHALYFLYDRKTAKSINPEMGPSSWGAASILSAFDESLAGVRDVGVKYDAIRFSPRWPVTGIGELRYFTGYEAARAFVDVRHVLASDGMRYRVQSPARHLDAYLLLPRGRRAKEVLVNGAPQTFAVSTVGESVYVDFKREGTGLYDIEVLFSPMSDGE
jgi:hypothetical protein